jgi:DNA-binding beta-propeller fold protein YncE
MKKMLFMKRMLCLVLSVSLLIQCGFTVMADDDDEDVAVEEAAPAKSQPGEVYAYDAPNIYSQRFFVPTQVYNFGGEFFIADAYNNQILHSTNVASAPGGWSPVGMGLNRPHAIASDGTIYLVVDTDNNRVVTYTKTDAGYQLVESFENVGIRPHYTVYDKATGQFYVWSSMTGTMYIYKREKNGLGLTLKSTKTIKDLAGYYTRSFTIDGGTIYFPCVGKSAIYAVNKSTFKVKAVYGVPSELSEMVQVVHIQNYYYLVTSADTAKEKTPMIVRSKTLSGFGAGQYEDVKSSFGDLNGIPYYITKGEDGHYYAPIIEGNCDAYICSFDVVNDTITNVNHMKY